MPATQFEFRSAMADAGRESVTGSRGAALRIVSAHAWARQ